MEKPAQFMEEIVCPHCERQGHAIWESSTEANGLRRLASLSDGFQMWPAEAGEDPKITCRLCGAIQPGHKSVGA